MCEIQYIVRPFKLRECETSITSSKRQFTALCSSRQQVHSTRMHHPSPKGLKVRPMKLLLLRRAHRVLLSETLLDGHIREKATELLGEARVDLRAEGHVQQL